MCGEDKKYRFKIQKKILFDNIYLKKFLYIDYQLFVYKEIKKYFNKKKFISSSIEDAIYVHEVLKKIQNYEI